MMIEERLAKILQMVEEKRVVTVLELSKTLEISESTIRRDLTTLDNNKKLRKVHGGAAAINGGFAAADFDVRVREDHHRNEKQTIGKFSAGLIKKNDFVYIDAGTTTEAMVDFIKETGAVYVTNGMVIAAKLVKRGCRTIIIGGEIKPITDAVVGSEALNCLRKYNFSKGFFGTNGIDVKAGFSTPDPTEAQVKREAFSRCKAAYVLADPSKFNLTAPVSFGHLDQAEIITTQLGSDSYKSHTKVWEVDVT
ncbi:DeoR/GlpR family DNA-binding transcription regulator [Acetobacterium malicum]|uniref:DeoR family transcriptional regulator n=1 Tax=Acetobacterium malicum TaxID=52692 RepID=A0ABR6Z1K7_9FIRM|nr:DeoR/GlpR family DNA-binding transcription regulator [Acetobacterium malicum]MBC3901161.1 DeoR family transcriptional regulator [Acetobacterium malicum]